MQAYQKYQRVNVTTADPLRLVIMLYEGAIKNLNQAQRLLETNTVEASAKIVRTQEIIMYLRNCLDHEAGGEIAGNLDRLYDYMRDILNKANIQRDPAPLQETIALLQTLLEGWRGIAANPAATTVHDGVATEPESPAQPAQPARSWSMVG